MTTTISPQTSTSSAAPGDRPFALQWRNQARAVFIAFAQVLVVFAVACFSAFVHAEAPAGFARIHYHRGDGNYASWGLHLWGDAHRLPKDTRWTEPFPPTGSDGFGIYFDVPIRAGAEELNFILHDGPEKHAPQDQVLALERFHDEAWLVEGDSNIYPEQPKIGGEALGWSTSVRLMVSRQPASVWYTLAGLLVLAGVVVVSSIRYRTLHANIREQQAVLNDARAQLERQTDEYREVQQRTAALSGIDELTGLLNRSALNRAFATGLAKARRSGSTLATFFIDLDDFKPINDTHGHAAGDHVLRTVAQRLSSAVRQSDAVARLGGDEFVMVAEDISNPLAAARLARKLVVVLTEAIPFEGQSLRVAASIGVALYPHDGDGADLIERADAAMYEAKHGGKNAFRFASPGFNNLVLQQSEVETRWRAALAAGTLKAAWRPIIAAGSESGAPLAWMTFGADRGVLGEVLLPEIASSDPALAVEADLKLLEETASRAQAATEPGYWILSPSQGSLGDPRFIAACREAGARVGAGRLVLELDALVQAPEALHALAGSGVSFALFCADAAAIELIRIVQPGLVHLRLARSGRAPEQAFPAARALLAAARALGLPTVVTLCGDEAAPELPFDRTLRVRERAAIAPTREPSAA
jgi:diguanylate cyclase (GGDEF)-like protein